MLDATDPQRELRHVLATLAYRATRSLQDPPEEFATLRLSNSTRTPLEIVSHMADLLEWALRRARAEPGPRADTSGEWSRESRAFTRRHVPSTPISPPVHRSAALPKN